MFQWLSEEVQPVIMRRAQVLLNTIVGSMNLRDAGKILHLISDDVL